MQFPLEKDSQLVPSWILWFLLVVSILFGILYVAVTWHYDYWKKRGVPCKEARFPFGNFGEFITLRLSFMDLYRNLYSSFEGQRYAGGILMRDPTMIIRDPELVKMVLVKDFSHFHDRGMPVDEENDPIAANLFTLPGSRWHTLRNKLSPTFTSGKMKYMFSFVRECAEQLRITMESETKSLGEEIQVKDLLTRYTTDSIGSVAFGVDVGSLENPNAAFRVIGRKLLETSLSNAFRNVLVMTAPNLAIKLGIRFSNPTATTFFQKTVEETVSFREKNNVKRADFLQLLIGLKNGDPTSEGSLTMNQLAAQCFIFFVGGFETSATTLAFCLYELAHNGDVQTDLRCEVDRVLDKNGGQITYDCLAEMCLMDRVIAETLRKYSPSPVLIRECTKTYTIPAADKNSSDGRKWKSETANGGHVIEVGTSVQIPICGLHYDPEYFPDPERFDPGRFTEEAKRNRPAFAYLPFGEGPRICIGMRFGQMQTKTALAMLVSKFEFRPSPKTPKPLVLDRKSAFPAAAGGIWVKVHKRTPVY